MKKQIELNKYKSFRGYNMSRKDKVKIFKILLMIIALAIFIGVIIYLFPVMKNLSTIEGQEAFKEKVKSSGIIRNAYAI